MTICRAGFTYGPGGPGPRAPNLQGPPNSVKNILKLLIYFNIFKKKCNKIVIPLPNSHKL
jgi:hypothetical protein